MSTPFILKFSIPANSNLTITLPINSYNGASIITNIEWDSGVSNTNFTYTYPQNTSSLPIIKTVRITGTIKWFGNGTHSWTGANCLIEVTSFSDNLVSLAGAFNNATQLTIVPTSLPSTVTNMNYMFANATVFNHPIGSWNTSAVTTMSGMFRNAQAFNQPIDSWDTSKVTYMDSMFLDAIAFNQSLNNWNTSAVTTMSGMFQTAIAFNQSLNKWDTSKVTQMEYMFFNASTFNGEINSWNTFAVTIMYNMFMGASTFNQPLNNWNTSNVTTMASMFENASAFNQPLNNWNTSKVTTMSYMFNGASAFNQSINNWNTSVVDNMSYMFQNASAFNQPLDNWNTSNVINMAAMFKNAPAFNQPLNNWNTSKVTSMAAMFQNASAFNQSINNWNTSKVTEMYSMFQNASAFNQPISNWSKKTSNTNMNSMFQNASAFNQQLSGWTTTTSMFTDATAYNNSLSIPPGIPTNLTATAGNTQVQLSWTKPETAGGLTITYVIQYSSNNGSEWTTFNYLTSSSTSATVTGLTNGTSYIFKVRGTNSRNINYSTTSSSIIPEGPFAPTISTTTSGNTQVSLSWTIPTPSNNGGTDNTDYIIQYSFNNGYTWSSPISTGSTTLNYTVTGLSNGTSYIFKVAAVNNLGTGNYSTNLATVAPSGSFAPTNLYVTPGNSQVDLSWTAPTNNGTIAIIGYNIQYLTGSGSTWSSPISTESTTLNYTVTGLTNGTSYIFQVAAVNSNGTANYSANSSIVIPDVLPVAPTNLTATAGDTQVVLSWTTPINNGGSAITGYNIQYLTGSGTTWSLLSIGSATNSYTVTGLTYGYSYIFRVAAVNSKGTGSYSDQSPVTLATVPGAPTDLTATLGDAQVSLTWSAPTSNGGSDVTGYTIEYSLDNGTWTIINDIITTNYVIFELLNGSQYRIKVKANNSVIANNQNYITIYATPDVIPNAPTILTAIPGNTQVVLSWVAPTSNGGTAITNYKIEYSANNENNWNIFTRTTSLTSTNDTIKGLVNGNSYKFRVFAVNNLGPGFYSNEFISIPDIIPDIPTDLTATPSNNNQVSLAWNAPANNGGSDVTGYTIKYSSDNQITWSSPIETTDNSATITGLTNNNTYIFNVAAVNNFGTGNYISTTIMPSTFSFDNSQTITKTYLDEPFIIQYPSTNDLDNFTYDFTSSNLNLIEITTVDNILEIKVTIKGATTDYGDVVITAKRAATNKYWSGEKTINIIVGKANTIINNIFINDKTMSNTVFTINEPTSNNPSRNFTYSISNQYSNIATISKNIDESATITMENAGNFIIDVNQDGNKNFNPGSSQININVAKIDADFSNLNFGPIVFAPNLFITINSDNYDNEIGTNIIFTSSNSNIAQIIENIDQVTQIKSTMIEINNAGTTIITAKQESNGIYLEKTISYELNIKKATGDFKFVFDNETNSTNLTKTYLVDNIFTIPYPTTTDIGDFTYEFTSSNPNLIEITTVDNNLGIKVTIKGATTDYGDVIITAKRNNSNNYNELSQSIQLSIEKSTQELKTITIDKEINIESLNLTQIWLRENLNNVSTRLFNLSLVNTQSTIVTISNSNDNSFTIGLNSIGQVKILATQLANYDFNESTVEITLNVNKINREINAFNNSPLEFKFNHGDFTLEETVESNIFRDNSFTYDFEVLEEQEFIEYNTINNNFKILGVGTNIIKITRNESEYHTEATKTITVTIVQADSVFTFNDNWNINKFYTDNDFNLINYVSTNDIQDEIHPFEYTFAISSIDSNPIVAEIKNNSQIHITDVGQSLITVTRKETLNYLPENKTTKLIIAPANSTFTGGTQQYISKTFTDKTYQIIPNTPDTNKDNSSFEYTYQTSNEKIALVNLTGLVTFNKSGNVVITVTRNSTSYFNAGTIEYNLTIGKSDSGFSISNISDNNIEKTFGDPNFTFNPINTISGNKINTGKITYQVIDKSVVQMKGNQMIILRSGSTKINVKQESDANYIESSKEITVTINIKTPSLSDFYSNGISKKIGDKPFIIVQPKSNSLGKFTYESSDTSIATIDTNGLVNIMDLGTAEITAKQDFNVWFNKGSINTTLYIKKIPQLSDFNTIIKQIGTETFQIIPPKSDSLGNFTYFSSDSSIATINGNQITIVGAGRAFIKAVQSENLIYGSGEIYTTLIVYSSGLNLSNLNLSGANMSYLNLSGFNFENSNMYNVNLLGANLSGANLTKANLTKANLQLAKLTKLELAGADLTGVDMSLTELVGTSYKLTNRSNILPYGWYYDKKTLTMLKPLRETLSEESLYTYLNNKLNSITESNTYLKHIINNNIYSNMLPNLDNIVIPAYQNQIYDYDGLIYINPIINKDWKIEYTIPNSQIQIIIEIPQNINKLIIGIKLPSEFKLGNKKFNGRDILLSILVLPINESNQIIQNSNSNVNILINILSSSNNYTLLCSSSNPNNNVKSQIKDNNSYKFIMGSFGEFLLTDYFVFDTVW